MMFFARKFSVLAMVMAFFALVGACGMPPADTTPPPMMVTPPPTMPEPEPEPPLTPVLEFEPLQLVDNADCEDLQVKARFPKRTVVSITYESQTQQVLAEIADDSNLRSQGLMCRLNVGDGEGMLFTFGDTTNNRGGFWMFNTYHPLDILYIRADNSVDSFRTMLPCPRTGGDSANWSNWCSAVASDYAPNGEYASTLELPAGWLARVGIDLNDVSDAELARVRVTWDLPDA